MGAPFIGNPFGNPVTGGGLTTADVDNRLAALGIGDIGTYTVATLPDPAATPRRTAWVTDLYSDQPVPGGRVVSESGFWKPIRPLASANVNLTGNMTLAPLLHSPTQIINGTIAAGVTRTITFATAGAYPGARFRVTRKAAGGLASVFTVLGTVLALGGWMDHEYDASTNTWVQTASGGLL